LGQARHIKTSLAAGLAVVVLSGCMGEDIVSRASDLLRTNDASVAGGPQGGAALEGERSALIDDLLNRRSVLPTGPYTQVASSVLAANSRAAEAQLRAAMLRSQARELNWLPTLGPQISLNSLRSVVANLVIEQTLFDNGAKRAEREFARADVEVAAVALAQDTNDRVYQALDLYLTAQSAQARAAVNESGMARMERFEYVMSERVNAGIRLRTHNQNMTVAARAIVERKTVGDLS
jgi:adhesin transport system outer membrane protein